MCVVVVFPHELSKSAFTVWCEAMLRTLFPAVCLLLNHDIDTY